METMIPTLAHQMNEGQIPVAEALQYALQIGEALRRIHDTGLVHGCADTRIHSFDDERSGTSRRGKVRRGRSLRIRLPRCWSGFLPIRAAIFSPLADAARR